MRIFVAGATGTLGRPVVRLLVSRGHDVIGLSRSESGVRRIEAMGARGVVGDALNAGQMESVIRAARPEQIVHLLTALPPGGVMRKRQLRPTNELRINGTANLIRAAATARVRRIVAESFVGVYGPATFDHPVPEDDPLPRLANGPFTEAVLAVRSLEAQLRDARQAGMETVVLRIGLLYGSEVPSTQMMAAQARAGRLFVPRGLSGIEPFVHNDDAAGAIVSAVEHAGASAVYNIADDEPMSMQTFLTLLAETLSAPPPRQVPAWVVKLAAPVIAEMLSAKLPLSNAKAKRELGWALRYPTVRDGLQELPAAA